jgi:hypothetical protein
MKVLIIIFFMYAGRGEAFCLPPTSNSLKNNTVINAAMIESAASEFSEIAENLLPSGETLTITFESLNPGINAEILKSSAGPVIKILGGMLKHPEMNKSALSLLLCHELGHYLGGPPLKSRNGWSSTEGQADYFSGETCARHLGFSEAKLLDGALNLTRIYSEVTMETAPILGSCDENRVTRTHYGYPKVQCRLDTIIAGWKHDRRPACWFFE